MALSITKAVVNILKNCPDRRMTAREIANEVMRVFPNEVEEKRQRSRATKITLETDDAMVQQIVAEIGAQRKAIQKKENRIKTTEGRPRKYYFTEKSDVDEIEPDNSEASAAAECEATELNLYGVEKFSEASLYPLLAGFLISELAVFSMRIDERRSKNNRGKGGNKWLYPDLVGMEDLSRSWNREVIDCAKEYSDKKTRLWSFEVKLKLNGSNVRESYFQAVSNSSWANIEYLVSSEIEGSETVNELRMLSGLHGIGVIRLDVDNVAESQIMIPARERTEIDWSTVSRLVDENSDFNKYVKLIRQFYQTGDPRPNDWDQGPRTA
mgnify:CR=1 FL=1